MNDHLAVAANDLRELAHGRRRVILGIAGPPGSGKSTVAEQLAGLLADDGAIVVPMDGFHLANAIIDGTPLRMRKGAIDTFDVGGYLALLTRLARNDEPVIYAPSYLRGLEEPIAASIAVPSATTFVVTEGNYLLVDEPVWSAARELMDAVWYVETPEPLRIARLIRRHVAHGMSPAGAASWARGSDAENARLVESTRARADRVHRGPTGTDGN